MKVGDVELTTDEDEMAELAMGALPEIIKALGVKDELLVVVQGLYNGRSQQPTDILLGILIGAELYRRRLAEGKVTDGNQ